MTTDKRISNDLFLANPTKMGELLPVIKYSPNYASLKVTHDHFKSFHGGVSYFQMGYFQFLVLSLFANLNYGLRDVRECGVSIPGGKIVGGVDSGGYHYPWFALLLLKKSSDIPIPICAGSLITKTHVLTAAHCFTISQSVPNENLFNVALGVYDICDDKEDTREIFSVVDVAVHERYRKRGKFYDIALIKLDRPADFTLICLPLSGVADVTETALLIGFGVTDENSNFTPCHMMEVNVTKFSKMDCLNTNLPLEDRKEPSVICAGSLTGDVDSCYGDSGGPLQTRTSDGRYVIAGIVSYGYGCATPEIAGIYTNVGSYIKWIEDHLNRPNKPSVDSMKKINQNLSFQRHIGNGRKAQPKVIFPQDMGKYNLSHSVNRHLNVSRTIKVNRKVVSPSSKDTFPQKVMGKNFFPNTQSRLNSTVTFPNN